MMFSGKLFTIISAVLAVAVSGSPIEFAEGSYTYGPSLLLRRPREPSNIALTLIARRSPSTPTSASLSPTVSSRKSPLSVMRDSQSALSIRTSTLPPPWRDELSDARAPSPFWYCRDPNCAQDPHSLPLKDLSPNDLAGPGIGQFASYFKCT